MPPRSVEMQQRTSAMTRIQLTLPDDLARKAAEAAAHDDHVWVASVNVLEEGSGVAPQRCFRRVAETAAVAAVATGSH